MALLNDHATLQHPLFPNLNSPTTNLGNGCETSGRRRAPVGTESRSMCRCDPCRSEIALLTSAAQFVVQAQLSYSSLGPRSRHAVMRDPPSGGERIAGAERMQLLVMTLGVLAACGSTGRDSEPDFGCTFPDAADPDLSCACFDGVGPRCHRTCPIDLGSPCIQGSVCGDFSGGSAGQDCECTCTATAGWSCTNRDGACIPS